MRLKITYEPKDPQSYSCGQNVLYYYVYDTKKYSENKVTKKEAVAVIFVKVVNQGQELVHIELFDKTIQKSEICELAKKQLSNFIVPFEE